MKISDVMTKTAPLFVSDSIAKAAAVFLAEDLDIVPVVDGLNNFIGTLTHENVLSAVQTGVDSSQEIGPFINRYASRLSTGEDLDQVPLDAVPAVIFDGEDRLAGVMTAGRFMTALNTYLTASAEKLETIINTARIGILAINERGIITFLNEMAASMIGQKQDALVGRYVADVIPETRLLDIMKTGKRLTGQKFMIKGTATMVNYAPVIRHGKVVGAVSVFQSLSNLEKLSRELETVNALNKELKAIFNSSDDGTWITDGEGVVLDINEAAESLTGFKAKDVIGRSMRELIEDGFFDRSAALLVMEKRERVTINQTVKGKVKFLVTGNPIFDDEGNIFRIVVNIRNVTKLVRLQDQLLKEKEQTNKYKNELAHLRTMQIADSDLTFRSNSMRQIVELAARIAGVNSTVLITGESGTGKELVAKLIHRQDQGPQKPLITINCAAIPEALLESELFGYEGGAFTGARKEGKVGMFELAHTGTLFLDEVGELPLSLQVKLLRTIQNREIYRVGGTKPIPVDVRIIAATNKDLMAMVREKTFREDLYYRLMVVPIHIPPLRDRKEDIPLLVNNFIDEFNHRFHFRKTILPEVMDRLVSYHWPGNVRELRNIVERIIVISQGQEITIDDLPDFLRTKRALPKAGTQLKDAVAEMETYLLSETYKQCGSWQKVAQVLGVNFTTVYRKASRYHLLQRH